MSVTRREVLQVGMSGLGVVVLGSTVPAFVSKMAFAQSGASAQMSDDNVLVVVQLSGGNDGLNTVVPHTDDAYHKARPYIGIKDKLLPAENGLALNPGMGAFKEMFDDGKLAIINGCGYPQPNRSHFRSMEIWQTANPTDYQAQGWLGHYIDHALRGTDNPLRAINIGTQTPQALIGESAPAPSIQSIDDFRVKTERVGGVEGKQEEQIIADLNALRDSTPALQYLSRQATNAILSADHIRKMTQNYHADATYPRQNLGQQLQLIAQLICGQFGTRVFYCQTGGFDTHANQIYTHENRLKEVAESIAAFHKDLSAKSYSSKVTVMCFSEFGRRVAQNNSNGTDHGAAGPMFVSGGQVKGGLYGKYPSLTDLDSGDLKYTTDFRRVYATLLDKWLNADSSSVLGNRFEPVAFL